MTRALPARAEIDPGTPKRVQRKRTKGWRMPANTVYVGRPGKFGNPFDWWIFGPWPAVDFFRRWLDNDLSPAERTSTGIDLSTPEFAEQMRKRILAGLPDLRGHDLACWCALDQPCHADVLLELANA